MTEDSLLTLFRKLILKLAPQIIFHGVHTYTVSRDNGDGTIDLTPAPKVLHGPHLRVEQMAAPGMEAALSLGDEVLLVFRTPEDRPAIIGHAPLSRSTPGTLKIDCIGAMTIGATSTAINIGGVSAVPLTKAAPVAAWAALVVTALAAVGQTVPALAAPATTKAKGV